jgi:hypothetical protein
LGWPFPSWFLAIWLGVIGWQWWLTERRDLAALLATAAAGSRTTPLAHAVSARGIAIAALAGTAAHVAGFVLEAGLFALVWASLGRRLHVWRYASWLACLSIVDIVARSFERDLAAPHPGLLATLIAGLGGTIVAHDGPGARAAFGSFGLATLARLGWSAKLQASDLGLRAGGPLVLTAVLWGVSRLVLWAGADLAVGRSVVR